MLFLLLPAAASAAPAALAPLVEARVLRGTSATTTLVVGVPDADAVDGPLTLELHARASARLDPVRSTLTVEVDGVPRASVSVDQLSPGGTTVPWRLTLPELGGGYHAIALHAALAVDADPCLLRDPRAAWLTVDPATRVRWEGLEVETELDLAGLPAAWQAADAPVRVDLARAPDPEGVAALMAATALLQAWGLSPAHGTETGPTLRLRAAEDLVFDDPSWQARLAPFLDSDATRAVVDLDGADLLVIGRTSADLAGALRGLADDGLRARCEALPCSLGTPPPQTPPEAEPPELLLDLASQGLPRGWTALGVGRHSLRLQWTRPPDWRVTGAPVLSLDLVVPSGVPPGRARVTAWLGDLPLQTWSLADAPPGPQRLVARLPVAAWADDTWPVRVEVELPADADAPCTAADQDATWVRIEPSSGLVVPREEQRFAGIAAFAELASGETPSVRFDPELTWSDWAVVAAVAPAFGAAEVVAVCAGPCITPRRAGPATALQRVGDQWHEPSGTAGLPVLDVEGRPLMEAACADGRCDALVLHVPVSGAPPAPPQPAGLLGRAATWDGRTWMPLAIDRRPVSTVAVGLPAPVEQASPTLPSDDARRLVRTDRGLLGLLLGVAALGGLWVNRSARRERLGPTQPVELES